MARRAALEELKVMKSLSSPAAVKEFLQLHFLRCEEERRMARVPEDAMTLSPDTASVATIESVLAALRADGPTNRELGDRFERLMRAYLTTDPLYVDRFAEVWLWQDWLGRGNQPDTGIDLVAEERDGGICAIQCKFYDAAHTLDKADIDSFFTASGAA